MGTKVFPVSYTGDGATKVFDLGFKFLHSDDIRVTVDDVLKVKGTDYAVQTPATDSAGATIRFFNAPANASSVKFYRNTPRSLRAMNPEIGNQVALQALYRAEEAGDREIELGFVINATDLAAGTAQVIIAPADGYITSLRSEVTETITTGGAITAEVAGVAVTGLSITVANSAAVGAVQEDTPTTAYDASTKVRRGQKITVTPAAAFAGGGAVKGVVKFLQADL